MTNDFELFGKSKMRCIGELGALQIFAYYIVSHSTDAIK